MVKIHHFCRGLIYQAQFFKPKCGGGWRGVAVCGGWGNHEAKPCQQKQFKSFFTMKIKKEQLWIPAGVYPCENRDGNDRGRSFRFLLL